MIRKAITALAAILIAAGSGAHAQLAHPAFEVVSIKANTSSDPVVAPITTAGGRFVANNYTLRALINWAYRATDGLAFLPDQIVGLPFWAGTDHFDIQAKPEGEARPVPLEEMQAMVDAMLRDRFQFKSHRETRQGRIYILTVDKPGKIKLSPDQSPPPPSTTGPGANPTNPPRGRGWTMIGKNGDAGIQGTIVANAVPIAYLVNMLQREVGGPVVDKTDLKALFDFNVKFTPESQLSAPATDPRAPSLFTALQDELGLKLESTRGAIEVLVVDSVSKPASN